MITIIGSINMDLTASMDVIPNVGETVLGNDYFENCGGKGANQAVAAARLGSRVAIVGAVGSDSFANILLQGLQNNGVDITWVRKTTKPSGIALIQVDSRGRNNIVVIAGSNAELCKKDVCNAAKQIASSAIVMTQLEIPMATVEEAMALANKHGCCTILNPAPAAELSDELLKNTDILVPNEHELARISHMPTGTVEECRLACIALQERGANTLVVTRGENGVFLMEHERVAIYPSHSVQAVDTTAAGDAFLGGFASALDEGKVVEEAIACGQSIAAFAVQRRGAQQSFPTRQEVLLDLTR